MTIDLKSSLWEKKCNYVCWWMLAWVTMMIAAAKLLQSCPTLCDPIDGSPPGSPVPGIHQARTLEWVAISFSNAWKWRVKVKSLSCVRLLATPWTAAYQAPPSMGFSRQEYWSGVPLPSSTMMIISQYILTHKYEKKKRTILVKTLGLLMTKTASNSSGVRGHLFDPRPREGHSQHWDFLM